MWVYADAWPRLLYLYENRLIFNLTEQADDAVIQTVKNADDNNFRHAFMQILKLEIELYQARFDKPEARQLSDSELGGQP